MNILKQILNNEVYPAVGCTEPVACAYAAAVAAERLGASVEHLDLRVDIGTYKNGAAVVVPCSDGAKGNLIAAAMGATLARSAACLGLLKDVTGEHVSRANALIDSGACSYANLPGATDIRVEARVRGGGHSACCALSEGHSNIELIEHDGEVVYRRKTQREAAGTASYREVLKEMSLEEILHVAVGLDDETRQFLREGIEMNLAMAERGASMHGAADQLRHMVEIGVLAEDLFHRVKVRVASAVDARMAGAPAPVMTSGGSGNQGILAILVPYLVGQDRGIAEPRILESIAIAHVINAYVKCFLGELSVICGCAVAAAIAASAAIVYQHEGIRLDNITSAVNNVIGDLSGLICDGAKPGCTMKTVSGVDSAMRAAFMAVDGFGLAAADGLLGRSAEESIRNLGRITLEGMFPVDPALVAILQEKAAHNRDAGALHGVL